MEKKFTIIKQEGELFLTQKADGCYFDATCPMREFDPETDKFEIMEADPALKDKVYSFRNDKYYLRPKFYYNLWPPIVLQNVDDEIPFGEIVLTVNLEEIDAVSLVDRAFINTNIFPEAMDFLTSNGLATDMGYRRSGFVEYPMVQLNLPLIYQHDPEIYETL